MYQQVCSKANQNYKQIIVHCFIVILVPNRLKGSFLIEFVTSRKNALFFVHFLDELLLQFKTFPPSNMILHALQASPIASLDDCFEDDNTNPKFYSILTYILSCTSFCYSVSCIFHCFLFRQNRMFTTVISLKTFMSQNINSFLNLSACLWIS